MLFNSLTFVAFFLVAFAAARSAAPWPVRKAALLILSFAFYAAADPRLLPLLVLSAYANHAAARAVARRTGAARRRAAGLAVAGNLALLALFKYGDFAALNLGVLARAVGATWTPEPLGLPLPVGISFFTFQALSYVVDVARGELEPAPSAHDFALYLSFFPQLVAGPIVRAADFLPQLATPRRASPTDLERGALLVLVGLFQKVVLADALLAPVADRAFARGAPPDVALAWAGTLSFGAQIYCDFAGYSTAAIGLAALLGFGLAPNFRAPYGAATVADFWRRWHVSLSTWLRDYLYKPLGGDRRGPARTYVNLLLVMLLGGLWHGAAWTFVAWGALHGTLLAVERAAGAARPPAGRGARAMRTIATFVAVHVAWVFFRAPDFAAAGEVLRGLVGAASADARGPDSAATWTALGVVAAVLLSQRGDADRPLDRRLAAWPRALYALTLAAMLVALVVLGKSDRAFLYFQF